MHVTDVESLPELVARRAAEHPERVFLQDVGGGELTWEALHERALTWAAALASLGVGAGDRVVTMRRNSVESVAIFIGLGWLHAVEVPVSTELRGNTLRHAIAVADGEVMALEATYLPRMAAIAEQLPAELSLVVDGDAGAADVPFRVTPQDDLLQSVRPASGLQPPRAHEVACVVFTSGTTGPSKGVVLPWANLRASGSGNFPIGDMTEEDCFYGPSSPSHVGAKTMPFLFAMIDGRIVVRDVFSTSRFWEEIARYGATTAILVGSMGHFLLSQPERPEDAETPLRNICMCPVMPEHEQFNQRFGTRIFTVFNMTETSCPIVSAPAWEIADWRSCGRMRQGSPGYELRIVDDADEEVADGVAGELMMRTSAPWTMNLGYLGMPEQTTEAWRNGWFHTGDIMTRDAEGSYFFVDRAKDAIRRSGENVSSFEVEAEVDAHPCVAECAAIAVPSEYAEDEIEIVVVPSEEGALAPEALIEFLVPRVPRYMVPRYVRIVAELPKNVRQRVQKERLRSERDPAAVWDRVAAGIELARE
ncbi:MAG TPA: AMP-binding protein [Solirubrobacteraceae bacterium]|jgi:crotonobetaine/carnitine-CoA ligase|nr:AMP-binding protein [Solirubrobacteraceae bacterium]